MDIFNDNMSVSDMVNYGQRPLTNLSLQRGIEYFDRQTFDLSDYSFSEMVSGYFERPKDPAAFLSAFAQAWEVDGLKLIEPFYPRLDFTAPKGSDSLNVRERFRGAYNNKHPRYGHRIDKNGAPARDDQLITRSHTFKGLEGASRLCFSALASDVVPVMAMSTVLMGELVDTRVEESKIVIVPYIQQASVREMRWAFLASAYCWCTFDMVPLGSCTPPTQQFIQQRSAPIVRAFVHTMQRELDALTPGRSESISDRAQWIKPGTRL